MYCSIRTRQPWLGLHLLAYTFHLRRASFLLALGEGERGRAISGEGYEGNGDKGWRGGSLSARGRGGEGRWPMVDLSYSHVIGNMGNRGSNQLQESASVT